MTFCRGEYLANIWRFLATVFAKIRQDSPRFAKIRQYSPVFANIRHLFANFSSHHSPIFRRFSPIFRQFFAKRSRIFSSIFRQFFCNFSPIFRHSDRVFFVTQFAVQVEGVSAKVDRLAFSVPWLAISTVEGQYCWEWFLG